MLKSQHLYDLPRGFKTEKQTWQLKQPGLLDYQIEVYILSTVEAFNILKKELAIFGLQLYRHSKYIFI